MEQLPNYKNKIDLISNNTSLIQPTQTVAKFDRNRKTYEKCNECNKRRKTLNESHQICHVCYEYKISKRYKPSGNKIIDDFIRYTQTNCAQEEGKMEFVPYNQFKDVEFIAERGFSKIYKATWIDGPVNRNRSYYIRQPNYSVALKKLNNSKNITSKELNELKVFYDLSTKREIQFNKLNNPETSKYDVYNGFSYSYVSEYFGITKDPITNYFGCIIILSS